MKYQKKSNNLKQNNLFYTVSCFLNNFLSNNINSFALMITILNNREKLIQWQDRCFFLAMLLLPFQLIPFFTNINFIFVNAGQISVFPLLIGITLGFYTELRYKNFFIYKRYFSIYSIIFFMLALASLFWSIIIFPWWNNLSIFGETNFLAKIKTFIAAQNIDLSEKTILEFWFFTRSIRDIIADFLYTFIVSYWICCLFVNRYTVAITLISKSFLCCLFVILPYAIVESSYLYLQADWAKNILSIINPILYDIPAQSEQKWWPPMFWPEARMRNVFAEPSYFGVWLVLLLPGLWYWLYVTKDKKWIASFSCLLGYISIFLTTARSAYCLAFGELFLLILSACFIHKKNFTKYVVNITIYFILALCISFTISQLSFNKQLRFSEYIYDNALNITSTKERSNESRYSIFFAHIQTGIESPLLGVGNVLVKAYLPKYLSHQEQKNGEIKNWLILQKEKGFLHSPIPELSEYSTRFAEKGILGLFIYILPFCVGSVLLFFRLSKEIYTEQVIFPLCLLIAFAAGCVSGFAMKLYYFEFWIILGLIFSYCFSKQNIKQQSNY